MVKTYQAFFTRDIVATNFFVAMFFRHRAYDLEHPWWDPDTGAAGDVGFACVAYAATFFK